MTTPRMPPAVIVMMLTLLLGIQPIMTDLYLPALPGLTRELATSVSSAQLTLSVLVICFGLAQLVCGPLSDRFGRRPVLLWGLALFTLASLWSAWAPNIGWLIAARAVQGAAAAAAVACGRSIVRDLFQPHEGARVMSRALGGLGVIAMLSPLVGAALAQWVGWRSTLLAVALFGAGTLAFVASRFTETLGFRNPQATQFGPLLRNWQSVARHRTFQAWVLLLSCTYGGLFMLLAASSFVYIDVLGVSRLGYGLIMASNSLAYITGTVLCRRLLLRSGLRGAVKIGGALSLAGGLGAALFSLAGVHEVWAVVGPLSLYAIGHGIHQPCGQAGAVGPFPEKAGTAAALSGFAMMVAASAVGFWLGRHLNGTVYPMTLGIGAASIGVALVAWTLVQRHGDPVAAAQAHTQPQALGS